MKTESPPPLTATDQIVRWLSWLLLMIGTGISAWLNATHAQRVGDTVAFHVAIPLTALLAGLYAELIFMSSHPRVVRWTAGLAVVAGFVFAMASSYVSILSVMRADMAGAPNWVQYGTAALPDAVMVIAVTVLVSHRWRTTRASHADGNTESLLGDVSKSAHRFLNRRELAAAAERDRLAMNAWLTAERDWKAEQRARERAAVEAWLNAERDWKAEQRDRERTAAERAEREAERQAELERERRAQDAEHAAVQAWLDAEKRHLSTVTVAGRKPERRRPAARVRKVSSVPSTVEWTAEHADELAGQLVSTGRVDAEPETVRSALVMLADGASGRAVAAELGISPTTASAWRRAAAELFSAAPAKLATVTAA